jgi:hypothetical protein
MPIEILLAYLDGNDYALSDNFHKCISNINSQTNSLQCQYTKMRNEPYGCFNL